jgi:Holliday junction DNA helicase RuvA
MIGRLSGIVDDVAVDHVLLDVNGVGYKVYLSHRCIGQLSIGKAVKLEIDTHVREDQITLYGFLSKEDKVWFGVVQSVQGVGAKVALSILGSMTAGAFVDAVLLGDQKVVQSISGIGTKLAARIINELQNSPMLVKLPQSGLTSTPHGASNKILAESNIVSDATLALTSLGFARIDAYKVVSEIMARDTDLGLETLIKQALAKMASQG